MKSPFPGMDPYLEKHWRDVHLSLVALMRASLNEELPPDLIARVDERVFVESSLGEQRAVYPDVRVIEHGGPESPVATATALTEGIALAEPLELHLQSEPVSEGYIEIIDVDTGNRVITMIELLSPANKDPGEGQRLYRQKQKECLAAGVSLVEIDLLRAGQRILVAPTQIIPPRWRTTYQVCVWRAWRPERALIYAVPLRQRLPVISVPLRESDPLARLDLQKLLDQCYRNGRYHTLNYRTECDPPLEAGDAAWADALLKGAGKR